MRASSVRGRPKGGLKSQTITIHLYHGRISHTPELETDDTYQRFVVNPPPNAVVVKTSFRDNPDLSGELRLEIEHLKANDPDEYEYVYEGMCRQAVAAAVYKNELLAADKEGGFAGFHMTPASLWTPFGTWDISITFRSGWLSLSGLSSASIDYIQGQQQSLQYYLRELQSSPYVYGTDCLPWDGGTPSLQTGRSIRDQMIAAGRSIKRTRWAWRRFRGPKMRYRDVPNSSPFNALNQNA